MTNERSARKTGLALTERQEILLCMYFDKECGIVSRYRAERLLRTRACARDFLKSLEKIGEECRGCAGEDAVAGMWDRIAARIDSEERAAIYLGRRIEDPPVESFLARVRTTQALFGGLSGAAVTAVALLLIVNAREQRDLPTIARGSPGSVGQGSAFTQITLDSGGAMAPRRARPAILGASGQSSIEVDWMRANGPLKFIQNPEGKSAIIWVRRRGSLETSSPQQVKITPTTGAHIKPQSAEAMLFNPH